MEDFPPEYFRTTSLDSSESDPEALPDEAPRYSNAPRYSAILSVHGRPCPGGHSTRPLRTEHNFMLKNGGAPWVTLTCISRARSPSDTLKYEGGDAIKGSVKLNLTSPTYISLISASVRGRVIAAGTADGSYDFLNQQYTIWSKTHGNPRHTSPTQNIKHRGKLDPGAYTWPFSIPFPTSVESSSDPKNPID